MSPDARTLEMPAVRPATGEPAAVELPRPERITMPLRRVAGAEDSADLINASPHGSTSYRFIAPRSGRRAK